MDDDDEPMDISDDDIDLEAELAAISGGGAKRPKPRKPAVPAVNLDAMIAESLKDIPSDEEDGSGWYSFYLLQFFFTLASDFYFIARDMIICSCMNTVCECEIYLVWPYLKESKQTANVNIILHSRFFVAYNNYVHFIVKQLKVYFN